MRFYTSNTTQRSYVNMTITKRTSPAVLVRFTLVSTYLATWEALKYTSNAKTSITWPMPHVLLQPFPPMSSS